MTLLLDEARGDMARQSCGCDYCWYLGEMFAPLALQNPYPDELYPNELYPDELYLNENEELDESGGREAPAEAGTPADEAEIEDEWVLLSHAECVECE